MTRLASTAPNTTNGHYEKDPTGVVYERATLAGIAELAIEHEFWVIFEECHGALTHSTHVHHPIVSVSPEVRSRTLIVNVFSKTLADGVADRLSSRFEGFHQRGQGPAEPYDIEPERHRAARCPRASGARGRQLRKTAPRGNRELQAAGDENSLVPGACADAPRPRRFLLSRPLGPAAPGALERSHQNCLRCRLRAAVASRRRRRVGHRFRRPNGSSALI